MAYDVNLADRLRTLLTGEPGLVEKRMFGGLAFLVGGHLVVSASSRGGLLLRIDPQQAAELLDQPGAEPFVMRGREMSGWLQVEVDASTTDEELGRWVDHGVRYVRSLPAKS